MIFKNRFFEFNFFEYGYLDSFLTRIFKAIDPSPLNAKVKVFEACCSIERLSAKATLES